MTSLICTPSRGRSTSLDYTIGLMGSAGAYTGWMPLGGQSDIYVARNNLANEFMQHKYDDLLWIDSDIGFTRQNVVDILATPEDVVTGLYPGKGDESEWIIRGINGDKIHPSQMPKTGLLEVKLAPCGFLKVNRKVFQAIADQSLAPPYGPAFHQYFNGVIEDNHLLSEDYSFSVLVRKAGFKIYANCGIRLTHDGRSI